MALGKGERPLTIAYFDCFAGISGDMLLGALIDLGVDPDLLYRGLASLGLEGYSLAFSQVKKAGLRGTRALVQVTAAAGVEHRSLATIEQLIRGSTVPPMAQELARAVFRRLAGAEAMVHGIPVESVHFHEVGAVDSIVDIVGSAIGLTSLGITRAYFSPLNTGRGFVRSAHGLLPVPAPATLELLRGAPVYSGDVETELVTPTGAAFVATLSAGFGPLPLMRVLKVGYGAGTKDLPFPNLLRITLGEEQEPLADRWSGLESDRAFMLEANLDDMNPQFYEVVSFRLFEAGALDVFLTPVQMKKSRPGTVLSVLAPPEKVDGLSKVIFRETTTLGLRYYEVSRRKLVREFLNLNTQFGPITIKVGRLGPSVVNVAPEYSDCRRIALERGIPIKEVHGAALQAAWRELGIPPVADGS